MATEATEIATSILELRDRDRVLIGRVLGQRSGNGLMLLDELFKRPVVTTATVERILSVSQPTASALVREFEEHRILEETTGRQRRRVFAYSDYLGLFPGTTSRT